MDRGDGGSGQKSSPSVIAANTVGIDGLAAVGLMTPFFSVTNFFCAVINSGTVKNYSYEHGQLLSLGKYSFDNFYTNKNNKQAFLAARYVAEHPGQAGNPLYIYGFSGSGKTHLLYAIGQYIKEHNPEWNVVQISTVNFINNVIDVIRTGNNKKRHDFVFGNNEKGISGCVAKGISEDAAEKIFDDMWTAAIYAFNKSHAAAYATLVYRMAWLKRYYSEDYKAAVEYVKRYHKLGGLETYEYKFEA